MTGKNRISKVATFAFIMMIVANGLSAMTDQELLARVDSLVSFPDTDFSAEYTIIQERPGQARVTTVAGVFRRDALDTYVVVVMQPLASRGQGYLKESGTLWFFDPQSNRFNSTSSADVFQNTNIRNSDFTRSTLAQDYRVVSGEYVMLGRFRARLLTLEAVHNNVTYPRMRVWINEQGLLLKTEEMSLSGQLLRTTLIPDYYNIGGRFVPRQLMFIDALRGAVVGGNFVNERTLVTVARPSFANLADSVFSRAFLENVNR
ncbi:MAG: outer membrane lipoprotein-sorting protein [Spirochaetes bacterium]|nr:outer membrane lipoprotein-sorting protein [Spirochaetota bacterium]